MAFGNYQNEKPKQKITTTQSYRFYNEKIFGSTLALGYFNATMTLKINPLLPENKRTQNSKYDYDTDVMCYLTPQRTLELLEGIRYVAERVNMGYYDFEPIGVPSGDGYVEIAPAVAYGGPEETIALRIYDGIDADGTPAEKLTYAFNPGNYFKNYQPGAGSYDKSSKIQTEFLLFTLFLKEALKASTNAIAHSIRHVNAYSNDRMLNNIKAMAEKLGVSIEQHSKSVGSYFNNNNKQQQESSNQDINSIENGGVIQQDRLPM